MTIGALLGDLANPYSAMILRAIETVAAERHVLVLGASINENAELEHEVITAMSRHRTDGMVVVPVNDDDSYLQQELNAGVSIVYIDRPPINLSVDSVVSDSLDASRDGTVHLINHGHRRIGYLGDLVSIQTAVERHRGYKEALQENGIAYDEALVTMNLRSESDAFEALVQLMQLSDPPTAVFTSQNLLTIGAVEALQTLGLQRSVALIGYDDFSLANLLDPGVTVIAQDTMAIGLTAATLLFERIDGYDGPPRAIVLPTTLIPRGSGEIRR
jgi:LacI family transcriptional regulator